MQPRHQRFERLIEPIHDQALAFARCLCRSHADGEDLFQEAVLRALAKLAGLRDDGAFRPWLYRVIISVHRDRCRRALWRKLIPLWDAAPEPSAGHDELDGTARARTALAALPANQREAIVLYELGGWQVDEIAAIQRVTSSAVKSRLARGREQLRAIYTRRLGVAAPATTAAALSTGSGARRGQLP